jgi:tRNA(fMet)-specific endonuclease VapC
MIFLDTCVIIEYLKKNEIRLFIEKTGKHNFGINSIVIMELFTGAFNKLEIKKIKKEIENFKLLEINQEIMNLSTELIENYSKSHSLTKYDSIIAASSIIYDIELFTYNIKDFKYIPGLKLYKE